MQLIDKRTLRDSVSLCVKVQSSRILTQNRYTIYIFVNKAKEWSRKLEQLGRVAPSILNLSSP